MRFVPKCISNQLHANERAVRQYGKQRLVKVFEIDDKVSVAVLALDRASTDDKRIFGRIIRIVGDMYGIQTRYGILDRLHPTSELMPLPDIIDLGIPDPAPTKKISLRYVSAQESTTAVTPVHCRCKDQKTWCATRRCACIKGGVKCSVACHGGKSGKDNDINCPNIAAPTMRTQKELRLRENDSQEESSKRPRLEESAFETN